MKIIRITFILVAIATLALFFRAPTKNHSRLDYPDTPAINYSSIEGCDVVIQDGDIQYDLRRIQLEPFDNGTYNKYCEMLVNADFPNNEINKNQRMMYLLTDTKSGVLQEFSILVSNNKALGYNKYTSTKDDEEKFEYLGYEVVLNNVEAKDIATNKSNYKVYISFESKYTKHHFLFEYVEQKITVEQVKQLADIYFKQIIVNP